MFCEIYAVRRIDEFGIKTFIDTLSRYRNSCCILCSVILTLNCNGLRHFTIDCAKGCIKHEMGYHCSAKRSITPKKQIVNLAWIRNVWHFAYFGMVTHKTSEFTAIMSANNTKTSICQYLERGVEFDVMCSGKQTIHKTELRIYLMIN